MPTAKDKRIAHLEKAAGRVTRRRPGQFTLEGLFSLLVDVCGADTRELVEAVLDTRPLPGRERLCEAVSRALVAVLSGDRTDYREACAEIRAEVAAVRGALESTAEIPQLMERGTVHRAVSPVPGGTGPEAVARAAVSDETVPVSTVPSGTGPEAPLAAVGEQLLAEVESLPDAPMTDEQVEEVRRRLPGEGPVRIPGVDPPDMRGWRPLGDGDAW